MISYLLLRSNKETGPYTLEELLNFGLKPYDLVWAKGKSAAWRYPSELDELKPFAAQVEEQPYDRFYKKQQPETLIHEAAIEKKIEPIVEDKKQTVEVIGETESMSNYLPKSAPLPTTVYTPKKSVFVTLPGQASKQAIEKKQIVVIEQKKPTPIPIPDYTVEQPTISISENPDAKVKYSQPLDEIKEMYVKTLYDRKTKIARKGFWLKNLKIAAVVVGLIGIGLVAGFIIKPKHDDKKIANINSTIQPVVIAAKDSNLEVLPVVSQPLETESTSNDRNDAKQPVLQEKTEKATVPDMSTTRQSKMAVQDRPKEIAIAKKADPTAQSDASVYNPSDRNPVTGERNRTVRDANQPSTEKAIMKSSSKATSYEGQVFVRSNDYKRVAFGGIRNLELTVTNNSKSELDNVVVELVYLKPSELPLRTENIVFKSIAVNQSSMIRIPDTNRGIKVTYKIISVSSREKGEAVVNNK